MVSLVDTEIKKMLEIGVIEPSRSWWSSPAVPVRKKDGSLRLCVDYREVNKRTKVTPWVLPRADELLQRMAGASFFSSLDAASGYWQIPLSDKAKEITAFSVGDRHFQFKVMPFGLVNAPSVFQRAMDAAFEEFRAEGFAAVYIDDIAVYSKLWETHLEQVEKILQKCREANIKLKLS